MVDSYPGLFRDVETYLNERIDEVLAGSSEPIVVRIFGQDLEMLRSQGSKRSSTCSATIPGLVEVHVELPGGRPADRRPRSKLAAAQRYGLKPGDVRRAAATLITGEEVGDIFREGKAYDVNVWSTPETRNSLTDVANLPIDTPGGGQRPLGEVADVRIRPTPNAIEREDDSRRIDVDANVAGRDLGSVVGDVADGARRSRLPARLPRRAARRVRGAPGGPEPAAAVRARRRDR